MHFNDIFTETIRNNKSGINDTICEFYGENEKNNLEELLTDDLFYNSKCGKPLRYTEDNWKYSNKIWMDFRYESSLKTVFSYLKNEVWRNDWTDGWKPYVDIFKSLKRSIRNFNLDHPMIKKIIELNNLEKYFVKKNRTCKLSETYSIEWNLQKVRNELLEIKSNVENVVINKTHGIFHIDFDEFDANEEDELDYIRAILALAFRKFLLPKPYFCNKQIHGKFKTDISIKFSTN